MPIVAKGAEDAIANAASDNAKIGRRDEYAISRYTASPTMIWDPRHTLKRSALGQLPSYPTRRSNSAAAAMNSKGGARAEARGLRLKSRARYVNVRLTK